MIKSKWFFCHLSKCNISYGTYIKYISDLSNFEPYITHHDFQNQNSKDWIKCTKERKKERKEDFVIQKQLEYNERPVNLFCESECKRTDLGDTAILLHH